MSDVNTLVGRGSHFEGKMTFEGTVRVDGSFAGEIVSDDTLIIGESAEVRAELDVATVIITIMSQVIGTTLLAYVLGTLISIVPNLDPTERNRLLAVNNLKDFIRDLNLEKHQRMSMMRHFNFYLVTWQRFNVLPLFLG